MRTEKEIRENFPITVDDFQYNQDDRDLEKYVLNSDSLKGANTL